ncbi:MAG: DUF4112 domain-containing protein [Gemmatimonadales bacterium]
MSRWRTDPPRSTGGVELERLRRIAWICEECFRVPLIGTRFGVDAVIGLVPGVGDAIGGGIAAWGIVVAARLGAPGVVLGRMLLNVSTDVIAGSIPLFGDLFDVGWKAHRRNVRILERWVADPDRGRRASALILWAVLGGVVLSFVAALALAWWLIVIIVRRMAG